MTYFPQLQSGALTQYPLSRTLYQRTIVSLRADGTLLKLDDARCRAISWELRYAGLSDAEREAIENFFRSVEGPLSTFTFLDPCGNMLRWSEDLEQSVWLKGAMLQVATEVDDGAGGDSACRITNLGQVDQAIEQLVGALGEYTYCFSCRARSDSPGSMLVAITQSGETFSTECSIGQSWETYFCSGTSNSAGGELVCKLQIPPGSSVEIQALSLAPQPFPGDYRRTSDQADVYESTRFDQDALRFTAAGINDHAVVLRLRSAAGLIND